MRAKEYLSKKGVKYTEYNVAQDEARAREMVRKSGQMGVPVIVIGEQVVVGFDQRKLDELIAKEQPAK